MSEEPDSGDEPLSVGYEIRSADGDDVFRVAREIAVEQTVELPEGCFSPEIDARIVGRLDGLERLASDRWRLTVSYPRAAVGPGLPQLLTVLYGNVSLKGGVRLVGVDWPGWLLDELPGPRFGVSGIQELLPRGADRPLLCGAAKPIGLGSEELAELVGAFARGGLDLVKDDHGLADQPSAPFRERVLRCRDAAAEAGTGTLYLPNLTGPVDLVTERAAWLREEGIRGAMVSPFVLGLDVLRWLAEESGLFLLAHPALAGAFVHPDHGIAPRVLFGDLLRLAGADGVIFPQAGGRFPYSESLCRAIVQRLGRSVPGIRSAYPVAGGGVDVATVPDLVRAYGTEIVLLIGGSLYRQGDVEEASRRLLAAVEEAVAAI